MKYIDLYLKENLIRQTSFSLRKSLHHLGLILVLLLALLLVLLLVLPVVTPLRSETELLGGSQL